MTLVLVAVIEECCYLASFLVLDGCNKLAEKRLIDGALKYGHICKILVDSVSDID